MAKTTLILPYFGSKFPNTFDILIESMKNNPEITFLVLSNINMDKYKRNAKNIIFITTTLSSIKKKAEKILGFPVSLETGYALCDFKPFYGLIFEKYLADSDWWGHFDSDIVLGDISSFLKSEIFDKYDRIFTHGHLCFYRNNSNINNICRYNFDLRAMPNYKNVLQSRQAYGFDEWGMKNRGRGLSWAINKTNIINQFDDISLFADISYNKPYFITTNGDNINYFSYKNGVLKGHLKDNEEKKYLYVHFQKRHLQIDKDLKISEPIYFYPNFVSNNVYSKYKMSKKMLNDWNRRFIKRRINDKINNLNIPYIIRRVKYWHAEK